MLARNSINANFATNLKGYVTDSWFQPLVWEQLKAVGITIVLSVVGTIIIAYITKALVGLRPTEEVEISGLDENEHGEVGYHD
jgi:Amt family ammonium transporter